MHETSWLVNFPVNFAFRATVLAEDNLESFSFKLQICNAKLMSQSIPTGYIPPSNPRENFFEQANPGHPGIFFV